MGNLVNLCGVASDGWEMPIKEMVYTINSILNDYENTSDVMITSIYHEGAILKVEWSWAGEENPFVARLINGAVELAKTKVLTRCIGCGKDKGIPPSTTVHPAHCEKCRAEFSPSSYKDNIIICLSGKAGSGKDTVADYLVKEYGFNRIALADPIRDIVQLTYVLDRENVWNRELRELPLENLPNVTGKNVGDFWSVRKLLQFVGTEMFRELVCNDTWVMNFVQRIEPGVNYVLTDVRFPNELAWAKEKFGGKVVFVEVTRPGHDGKGVGIENHESERYKLASEVVIENDGTLEDLNKKVSNLMKDIMEISEGPRSITN